MSDEPIKLEPGETKIIECPECGDELGNVSMDEAGEVTVEVYEHSDTEDDSHV